MHRMEGKKYVEIASSLSLSVKTVEAEMTKALRTLRNEIDNYILTEMTEVNKNKVRTDEGHGGTCILVWIKTACL